MPVCPYCNRETEPYFRFHSKGDCEQHDTVVAAALAGPEAVARQLLADPGFAALQQLRIEQEAANQLRSEQFDEELRAIEERRNEDLDSLSCDDPDTSEALTTEEMAGAVRRLRERAPAKPELEPSPDPAAIQPSPHYHWKAGAVFEPEGYGKCAPHSGIISHQWQAMVEENRQLKERVAELETVLSTAIPQAKLDALHAEAAAKDARVVELQEELVGLNLRLCFTGGRKCIKDESLADYLRSADKS